MSEDRILSELDFSQPKQYTLSVHLCTDAFFFSIYDPSGNKRFTCLRYETDETISLTANVKQIFESHEFLNYPFKRVNIVLETSRYTLIPFELFEDEQAEKLFAYSQTEQDNEKVLHTILPKCNIALLFGMDRFTYSRLTDRYPEAYFYCQMAPLAEYFCSQSRVTDAPELYAVLHETGVNVFAFNRGGLILANTFKYLSGEDLTYYILSIWQKLELQPKNHRLFLCGEATYTGNARQKIAKFIRHIESLKLPESIFGAPHENQSFTLQALHLCE